jgi:hypothetical protein
MFKNFPYQKEKLNVVPEKKRSIKYVLKLFFNGGIFNILIKNKQNKGFHLWDFF